MLFNSLEFALFFFIAFILYWYVFSQTAKTQNFLIFVISSIFYGWWDWRFLFLLYFTSLLDYFLSHKIEQTYNEKLRKLFLILSIATNLIVLGFFKYFNFFIQSWIDLFGSFGISMHSTSLNIILPVGISFYTFQSMSYTIDVYRKKITPPKSIINFLAFISFFPQLVAGPIERASHMLPQFSEKRVFNKLSALDGVKQFLWGLFKKVVIADNCATIANNIFENYSTQDGSTLFLGAIMFTFQIYGDFSGYSDMALGTAKFFGFNLMINFKTPYFSRDIAEFWRRWHISLSTWFRDYVYIPLGGSKGNIWLKVRNVFIIFLLSGLWHGANWTFIVWGFINACYFLPILLLGKNRQYTNEIAQGRIIPNLKEVGQIGITFLLTVFAWIFFRAVNISQAFNYIKRIFSSSFFTLPQSLPIGLIIIIISFIVLEWLQREKNHVLEFNTPRHFFQKTLYYSFLSIIIWSIILWSPTDEKEFIYFQF